MKISLIVPYIDTWPITKRCIEKINENSDPDTEVILIDNGSAEHYDNRILDVLAKQNEQGGRLRNVRIHRNDDNTGVLATFKQGLELSTGDVICFIHNDVLIQEQGWDIKVSDVFASVHDLGLAGLFGAVGVGNNGGRIRSQSKMLGLEWGACECHDVAWKHHSEYLDGLSPATILDGVGMFFSRKALTDLTYTDMFDDWRAPHHFYDRTIPLKLIDRGYKIATIGIGFDHFSGQTANSSTTYFDTGKKWLESQSKYDPSKPVDQQIYNIAEEQFFSEFGNRLPATVDSNWNYSFQGVQ